MRRKAVVQSELSANLGKADMTPLNNNNSDKRGMRKRSQGVWRQRSSETEPLIRACQRKTLPGQNLLVWSKSTNITWLWHLPGISPPPGLLWRQLFPNPWMLRWRLSHPPILLSGLWSLGWDLAVSNVGQLKIPQRWKQREGNLQHHPPVRAKIGRNQMAPHRKLPSAGSPSKKIK